MYNALGESVFMRTQNINDIAMRISDVQDYRFVKLISQIKLTSEDIPLNIARRQIVIVVKADFTKSNDFTFSCQPLGQYRNICPSKVLGVVRMNAYGGIHSIYTFS